MFCLIDFSDAFDWNFYFYLTVSYLSGFYEKKVGTAEDFDYIWFAI